MLGIALHPSYPAKPLVYVYATRSAERGAQQPDPAVPGPSRLGRQPDGAVHERRGRQPVPQRRADRVRARRDALRDRRRRARLLERSGHHERGPGQDHPHRARRRRPERQPVRRPRVGVRDPELVRLRVRSADRRAVGDRERAVLQRRDQPDPGRRELRLGAERDLRRRFPRQHEPGRPEPGPARALLRRARSASPASRSATAAASAAERGRGVLRSGEQRPGDPDRVQRLSGPRSPATRSSSTTAGAPSRTRSGPGEGSSSATSTGSTSWSASDRRRLAGRGAAGVRSVPGATRGARQWTSVGRSGSSRSTPCRSRCPRWSPTSNRRRPNPRPRSPTAPGRLR